MELDDVAVELRTRDGPEAVDVGMAVSRRFFWAILGPWLVVVGAVFALVTTAAVFASSPVARGLFMVLPWLLKPAFDRIPLFVVSRGVFGDVPSFGRTLRHVVEKWTSMTAVFDCTVRRFSPYRSLTMPIRDLEQSDANRYDDRKKALLRRNVRWPGMTLTGVGMAAEQVVMVGLAAAITMVLPTGLETGISFDLSTLQMSGTAPGWLVATTMGVYFAAVTLVEIFYVGGGFGLYINRRVELEGWDVELEFRRMADRFRSGGGRGLGAILVAGGLAALTVCAAGPSPAQAEEPSAPYTPVTSESPSDTPGESGNADKPQEAIDRILEAEEFGHTEKQRTWELREDYEQSREHNDWGEGLLSGLGGLLEVVLWGLAGAGVIAFGYILLRRVDAAVSDGSGDTDVSRPDPTVEPLEEPEQGTEMRLPEELVREASGRWEDGESLESLSLLYQGTLQGLARRDDIDIAPHMTAHECQKRVERAGGPGRYVARLAEAWTSAAYADRLPSDDAVRALFDDWRRHFAGGEE
jgi:hypothetical protein